MFSGIVFSFSLFWPVSILESICIVLLDVNYPTIRKALTEKEDEEDRGQWRGGRDACYPMDNKWTSNYSAKDGKNAMDIPKSLINSWVDK